MSKTEIPPKVRQLLCAKAAGRCEYRGCNKLLTRDELTKREGKFSVFAHIIADSPDGPRGHATLSEERAKSLSNLMLLCFDHHRLIDEDDVPGHPVDLLEEFKQEHEDRIEALTAIDKKHQTQIIRMEANIGGRKGMIDVDQAKAAVLPKYPVDDGIEILLTSSRIPDGAPIAWQAGKAEIDLAAEDIHRKVLNGPTKHLSIFGFAPIPLLIYLGRALGDIAGGTAFQKHRDTDDWLFKTPDGQEQQFEVSRPDSYNLTPDVAVMCSVSGKVARSEVEKVQVAGTDVYEIAVPTPGVNVVRTHEQVLAFGVIWRQLLTELYARYGADVTVHVFPALPVSLSVELGRVLLPKSDPEIRVYDFNRAQGGFQLALTLDPEA